MVKSPAYSPLDSLVDLACRDGVDIRPTLLRVITDLYVQKPAHTAEEETQYVELALGLIGAVDAATRATVAARLKGYANAPRAVLERLAAFSTTMPSASQPEQLIARLPELPAAPAPATSVSASEPVHDLIELFFSASAEERRLILLNLDAAVAPALQRPTANAETIILQLESSALQRNAIAFTRLLERGLGVGGEVATRIVRDPSGESIVVAAKALGMRADVLQRILLFLNPAIGQSVERVFELAQLYQDISWTAAEYMVAIWRRKRDRLRPQHAPALWDDERSGARTRATPAQHRGARTDEAARPVRHTGNK